MGTLLGYLLGRRRERPEVQWAHRLDEHADELRRMIDDLERQNAVLAEAVGAAEDVVPLLRPENDEEHAAVADLLKALRAVDAEMADRG